MSEKTTFACPDPLQTTISAIVNISKAYFAVKLDIQSNGNVHTILKGVEPSGSQFGVGKKGFPVRIALLALGRRDLFPVVCSPVIDEWLCKETQIKTSFMKYLRLFILWHSFLSP